MDLVVRYFDDNSSSCITQYLTSTFLDRARAEDLREHFCKALEGLPMENIVQISMDGPQLIGRFWQSLKSISKLKAVISS